MADPLLSFLQAGHKDMHVVDSCNGLLLCDRQHTGSTYAHHGMRPAPPGTRYLVCNPATIKWIDLPDIEPMRRFYPTIRLGFDPVVSPDFRVLLVVHAPDEHDLQDEVTGVQIYSSESQIWEYKESGWGNDAIVRDDSRSAFFNGTLHLTALDSSSSILTVDIDGKKWGKIPTPCDFDFIGLSQGNLYTAHRDNGQNDCQLSIWALEDYGARQWIMKHSLVLESKQLRIVYGIHPEESLIFLATQVGRLLFSYDFSKRQTSTIERLGENSTRAYPYIPWLS